MKRIALIAAAAALITGAVVPAAAASGSGSSTGFTMYGQMAGAGVTGTVVPGQYFTFVFTMTNTTHRNVNEDLVLKNVTNVELHQGYVCTANGMDGKWCEPGGVAPGESVTLVVAGEVHSPPVAPLVAAARACAINEDTGVRGPCMTVKEPISS